MNKLLLAPEFEPGVYIVFLVLLIVAAVLLILLFGYRVRKERSRYFESHVEKGITTVEWLEKYVTKVIAGANRKTMFYLYQVDIRDYDNLKKAIGETQYKNLQREVAGILSKLLPWGIKVSMRSESCMVIYVKHHTTFDVEGIARLIIDSVAKNITLSGTLSVEISVNVAIIGYPSGGDSAESLLQNLELAMVVSRRKGVNNYAFYTPQMGNKETDEYKYYQEIKDAMKAKEFTLFYQPVVDTNTMVVYGAESLIRWKHRTLGVLPPSNFLYVMEKTGDINWVGFWCFEQMVKQNALWHNNYENRFVLGINLSERQLLNPDLADEMRNIVRKHRSNPSDFAVEIAGFSLYNSSIMAKQNIDKLAEYGFRVTLDSFGTGYSSPSSLENFPVSVIKVDGKFWRKAKDGGIVYDIIEMLVKYCQEHNILLVMQGVENAEELNYLRSIGANYMQGYLFAPPRDAKEFISDVLLTPWEEAIKESLNKFSMTSLIEDESGIVVEDEAITDDSPTPPAPDTDAEGEDIIEGKPLDSDPKKN